MKSKCEWLWGAHAHVSFSLCVSSLEYYKCREVAVNLKRLKLATELLPITVLHPREFGLMSYKMKFY